MQRQTARLVLSCCLPILTSTCWALAGPAFPQSDRPHLVLFIADDMTWNDCGPYGSRDVRTPNLDALARESLRFDQAFAASPTCTPSRSSIYTGLYPFRNGAHTNHSLIKDGLRTLPQYLKELGYRVVIAGKTHIGPRESFPFEYLPDSNVMPSGKHDLLWTDLNTPAVDHLLATHDAARPLCLIICSHSPHVIWLDNDGYNPAAITLPPYLVDTPETRKYRCRYYTDVSWMDRQVGEVLSSLRTHGYEDRTLFMFTADQGAQWPFAKWTLYDAGIHAPLLVRWPGHAQPGATSPAMVSLIDLLPTIIDAAGGTPPSDLDGISFLPVLSGRSNHHRDAVFASHTGDGDMNRSPMRCVRTMQYKYILNLAPDTLYTTHINKGAGRKEYWESWVRSAESNESARRLVQQYEHRPREELFDVSRDSNEQHNLAGNPQFESVLSKLREQLKDWRIHHGEDLTKVPMPEDARIGKLRYAG